MLNWIVWNRTDYFYKNWDCPRDVMVKALACGIVVGEFKLQLRYYVHF